MILQKARQKRALFRMEATFDLLPDVSIEGTCPTGPSGNWGSKGEYSTVTAINNIDNFVKQWEITEQWLRCTGKSSHFHSKIELFLQIIWEKLTKSFQHCTLTELDFPFQRK